jgi:AcrR family transcriptional regulator
MRETIVPGLDAPEQLRRLAHFYVHHWTAHPEYFQIFWALENEAVIGALPDGVVAQVTGLWGKCLRLLTEVLERGQREGRFRAHDAWEVANVLWTLVNGLIQGDQAPAAKTLRERPLDGVVTGAIELVLRGLAPG